MKRVWITVLCIGLSGSACADWTLPRRPEWHPPSFTLVRSMTDWMQADKKKDAPRVEESGIVDHATANKSASVSRPAEPASPAGARAEADAKDQPAQMAQAEQRPASDETPATSPATIYSKFDSKSQTRRTRAPSLLHAADQAVMMLIDAADLPAEWTPVSDDAGRSPRHLAFYLDRYEVTAEQFKKFDAKYDETQFGGMGKPCPHCPAMGIDWFTAEKYCAQMGKRLPSAAEWDLAAMNAERSPWPWGGKFQPALANTQGAEDGFPGVAPVGSFPRGASRFGVQDMIGNVWEWVATPPQQNPSGSARVVKGGGWTSPPAIARIDYQNVVDGNTKNPTFGFRCAKSAS